MGLVMGLLSRIVVLGLSYVALLTRIQNDLKDVLKLKHNLDVVIESPIGSLIAN